MKHKGSRFFRLFFRYMKGMLCSGIVGCTTVVAGKKATAYGCVMLGHNEDNGSELSELYKVPRRSHPQEDITVTKEGGKIPQAKDTWAYLWAETPREIFCDFYLNQWGVAVTNNMAFSKLNDIEDAKSKGRITEGGIDYWLSRFIAERAMNAREGLMLACSLINRFGYNVGGRVYVVADRDEAWVLCAAMGKYYYARRVPDDEVVVVPNSYVSGNTDGVAKSDIIFSKDIMEEAASRGLYDPEKGPFRFDLAFEAVGQGILSDRGYDIRQWVGQGLLLGRYPDEKELPFSVKPREPVTLYKMKQLLRNHNEGTRFDLSDSYSVSPHISGGETTICRHDTKKSIIAQFRNDVPEEFSSRMWMALKNPCSSIYVPFYAHADRTPGIYGSINDEEGIATHFDREPANTNYAWKEFSVLKEETDKHYGTVIGRLEKEICQYEKDMDTTLAGYEKDIYENCSKEEIAGKLSEVTQDMAADACVKCGEYIKMIHDSI